MTNDKTSPRHAYNPAHLRHLGWHDSIEHALDAQDIPAGDIARVVSVQRGLFLVSDGQDERLCAPAGRLLSGNQGDYPVTGDWVVADDARVLHVLPRRNMLARGEAGSRWDRSQGARSQQPIAANLDCVFIVCGLDRDFNPRRIERYMTLVYNCGLSPVVVLTKADLHADATPFVAQVEAVAFGAEVIATSMHDGRNREALERHMTAGRTVAMLGSSGAGKSTLANMLAGSEICRTAAVSESVGKGRHTTTTRELIRMPQGGLLLDNPGIREIAFPDTGDGLDAAFADIAALAEGCRFADCTHTCEPGCAVLRAVETGELEEDRLNNYRKMGRELHFHAERQAKGAQRVEKERRQGIALMKKTMRRKGR